MRCLCKKIRLMYQSYKLYFAGFFATSLIIILLNEVFSGDILVRYSGNTEFDHESASKHLEFFTKDSRVIGNEHYNASVEYILESLRQYNSTSKNKFEYELFESDKYHYQASSINGLRQFIKTVIVKFNFTNDESKTLYLSGHVDGHAAGPTYYDDIMCISVMLELVNQISKSDKSLNYNLNFLFIGGEEYGLEGADAYSKSFKMKGHVLNMEAIAAGRPLVMTTKAAKSTSVVRAWSKVKGAIGFTYFNDLAKTSLIKSTSDLRVYEKFGVTGAELVYTGNPSYYHTKFDLLQNRDDIKYHGNLLTNFLKNFEIYDKEENEILVGVAPFNFCINLKGAQALLILMIIITVVTHVPFFNARDSFTVLFVICSILLSLIPHFLFMFICWKCNPVSYGNIPTAAAVMIPLIYYTICGFVISFTNITENAVLLTRTILDIIFGLIVIKLDLCTLVIFWLGSNAVMSFLKNYHRYLRFFMELMMLIPSIFVYSLLFRAVVGYTVHMSNTMGEAAPFAVGVLFGIKFFLSFISFAIKRDESEEEKIQQKPAFESVETDQNEEENQEAKENNEEIENFDNKDKDVEKGENIDGKDEENKPKKSYFNLGLDKHTIKMRILLILIPICIVIYFCVRGPPYDSNYMVKGWFGQFINKDMSGQIYFVPENGNNPIKALQKAVSGLTFDKKFIIGPFEREALYIKQDKSTLPDFIPGWPNYTLKIGNNGFDLQIQSDSVKPDILYLFANCSQNKCIKSISGFNNLTWFKDNKLVFKYAPFEGPFNLSVETNTKAKFELAFMWFRKSDELMDFEKRFPLYVVDFDKSYRIGGTLLVDKFEA